MHAAPEIFTGHSRPVPKGRVSRVARALWRQGARTLNAPPGLRFDGQAILVTGGTRGIGAALAAELSARGAEVVVSARRAPEAGRRPFLQMDLGGDMESVRDAVDALPALTGGRPLDMLVLNAGIVPERGQTVGGREAAYAVNVLGHHRLFRALHAGGQLADGATVVVVTGDVLIFASSPEPMRGVAPLRAYARSKLGNLWQAREMARRFPNPRVVAVHPGGVATTLDGSSDGWRGKLKRITLISPELAARSVLVALDPEALPGGSYFHNVYGEVPLPESGDAERAAFWERLEEDAA